MPSDTRKRSVRPATKAKPKAKVVSRSTARRVGVPLDHSSVARNGGKKVLKKYGRAHYSRMGKLGNAARWAKKKAE